MAVFPPLQEIRSRWPSCNAPRASDICSSYLDIKIATQIGENITVTSKRNKAYADKYFIFLFVVNSELVGEDSVRRVNFLRAWKLKMPSTGATVEAEKFRAYNARSIQNSPYWSKIPCDIKDALGSVSQVLPFRTNEYVLRELIDWSRVPDDPIFRLTFPHRDMLSNEDYRRLRDLLSDPSNEAASEGYIEMLRQRMNPHPAGQMTHNVPMLDGRSLPGLQHKYAETVLFFPAAGQTCHAYCSFCFRWPQFVGREELKFNAREADELRRYLMAHPEVTDVLVTGGDPMVMNAASLAGYLEPLLSVPHLQNIRIGTKSVAYWPQRFVTDRDADDVLRLFERVVANGMNLSIMAHYNHPAELRPEIARQAVRRITATGATVRMQSPVVRHINDSADTWRELWTTGVRLGAIPYYMFVERNTGPQNYFALPLVEACEIFKAAYQRVSGLSRTVRGPSMSTLYGKVLIDGVATVGNEKVFALQFLQARNPEWVRRPFFAKFDPKAVWFDDLQPAFGESCFFYERERENRYGMQINPTRFNVSEQLRAPAG